MLIPFTERRESIKQRRRLPIHIVSSCRVTTFDMTTRRNEWLGLLSAECDNRQGALKGLAKSFIALFQTPEVRIIQLKIQLVVVVMGSPLSISRGYTIVQNKQLSLRVGESNVIFRRRIPQRINHGKL